MSKRKFVRNYNSNGELISLECGRCRIIKPISEFNKNNKDKDKINYICKECVRKSNKKYKENNKDRIKESQKEYYLKNKEKINNKNKEYKKNNKDKINKYHRNYCDKKWRGNNKDKLKERIKKWRENNKDKLKEYNKNWYENDKDRILEQQKEYYNQKTKKILEKIKEEVEKEPEKYNYIEGEKIFGIIYLVHNIESDRYYVGQTTVGFDIRYKSGWLYKHSYKQLVKEDLELYGEDSFEYIKIFKVAYSQYELDKLEAYYIDYYNSYEEGYNERRGNIFTNRGIDE